MKPVQPTKSYLHIRLSKFGDNVVNNLFISKKVIDVFDKELQEFVSQYLTRGDLKFRRY